jgi:hypothetical protein
MPIEPRLYQKYTGKMPGEAMGRMGESLAESAGKKSAESMRGPRASAFMTWYKWRLIASVIGSIVLLIGVALGLIKR